MPDTLSRDISPPPLRKNSTSHAVKTTAVDKSTSERKEDDHDGPSLAAIEAGQAQILDHLEYFMSQFEQTLRPTNTPTLSLEGFQDLYKRNQHEHGRHFVIHQHDHPVSGVHYDLRLQFSRSSSLSFAVPYGLPGNPNSVRPIRMAVETRVHNLWNHLIESASHSTGSLLIWDTGEYEILPWRESKTRVTDDELSEGRAPNQSHGHSQSEQLFHSFRRRRIRLRLHGTRLPPGYTISMWLRSGNDRDGQPRKPKRKRRRLDPAVRTTKAEPTTSSDGDSEAASTMKQEDDSANAVDAPSEEAAGAAAASDDNEDATIRANNAYPGATNTIGSIHQRNWFLTLDKKNSGFRKARSGGFVGVWKPFFVRGRDYETSVVTGRDADAVMKDAGVDKFVGRKMWRPILE